MVRLPLLLWLGVVFLRHLGDREYQSLFGGLNLGIHEVGHYLFMPFGVMPLGEFGMIAGGTLLQLAAPIVAAWMFLRQEDYFGIAVAVCWLGTSLYGVARYAEDARARMLNLVSPGSGTPIHDWHYLLGRTGLLEQDQLVGSLLRLLGAGSLATGLVGGGWLLWIMHRPDSGAEEGAPKRTTAAPAPEPELRR
ncbi:MAG: hypothetical protein WDZ89_02755 [Gemmatimonadota bacterium]